MKTELRWIGERARRNPKVIFNNLYHHITNVNNLRECYGTLARNKATGVDDVTKEEYGKNLENNINNLSTKLKQMSYCPKPRRRSLIPKLGSKKKRPLSISCLEDKIVETALKRVLEPVYETEFLDNSYGFRPRRNQHKCLDKLGKILQQQGTNYVVEADIRSYFDEVNHKWLIKFLQHRIKDPRIIRLIKRLLRGGILEEGLVRTSEKGTPQGSIISPLLSNIYGHYVLDLWFKHTIRSRSKGKAYYFRFADDFLACFQYRDKAESFQMQLKERLNKFGLELAVEKTQCIEFGRFARKNAYALGLKPKEFTFLGFVHYCGKTRNGYFKVKRRTNRKKLIASLHKLTDWARRMRGVLKKGEMLRQAKIRITGYLNYYAITDNISQCRKYVYYAKRILFKWLNRKSQRKAYTWEGFSHVLASINWPKVSLIKDLNPCKQLYL